MVLFFSIWLILKNNWQTVRIEFIIRSSSLNIIKFAGIIQLIYYLVDPGKWPSVILTPVANKILNVTTRSYLHFIGHHDAFAS